MFGAIISFLFFQFRKMELIKRVTLASRTIPKNFGFARYFGGKPQHDDHHGAEHEHHHHEPAPIRHYFEGVNKPQGYLFADPEGRWKKVSKINLIW